MSLLFSLLHSDIEIARTRAQSSEKCPQSNPRGQRCDLPRVRYAVARCCV